MIKELWSSPKRVRVRGPLLCHLRFGSLHTSAPAPVHYLRLGRLPMLWTKYSVTLWSMECTKALVPPLASLWDQKVSQEPSLPASSQIAHVPLDSSCLLIGCWKSELQETLALHYSLTICIFFLIPFLHNLAFLYSPFQRIQTFLPHHLCDLTSQEMTLVYIVWLYIGSSIFFLSDWKTSTSPTPPSLLLPIYVSPIPLLLILDTHLTMIFFFLLRFSTNTQNI